MDGVDSNSSRRNLAHNSSSLNTPHIPRNTSDPNVGPTTGQVFEEMSADSDSSRAQRPILLPPPYPQHALPSLPPSNFNSPLARTNQANQTPFQFDNSLPAASRHTHQTNEVVATHGLSQWMQVGPSAHGQQPPSQSFRNDVPHQGKCDHMLLFPLKRALMSFSIARLSL
jgi:hypothetical protein